MKQATASPALHASPQAGPESQGGEASTDTRSDAGIASASQSDARGERAADREGVEAQLQMVTETARANGMRMTVGVSARPQSMMMLTMQDNVVSTWNVDWQQWRSAWKMSIG